MDNDSNSLSWLRFSSASGSFISVFAAGIASTALCVAVLATSVDAPSWIGDFGSPIAVIEEPNIDEDEDDAPAPDPDLPPTFEEWWETYADMLVDTEDYDSYDAYLDWLGFYMLTYPDDPATYGDGGGTGDATSGSGGTDTGGTGGTGG